MCLYLHKIKGFFLRFLVEVIEEDATHSSPLTYKDGRLKGRNIYQGVGELNRRHVQAAREMLFIKLWYFRQDFQCNLTSLPLQEWTGALLVERSVQH